ncbi:MAG: hypothetical protein IJM81_08100 [Prevotella sp.]|nr:hypothetical protein [Prevotella sp.]
MLLVGMVSCSRQPEDESVRGMYYWRTTFALSSEEQDFLKDHNVSRLYVRYFDVVIPPSVPPGGEEGGPMPNATIKGLQPPSSFINHYSLPTTHYPSLIPVVFITNDCMVRPPKGLAEKILTRVLQMNETHDIGGVSELQIDCDWTLRTRKNFFAFLEELRPLAREKGISLSATIRLHQLSQPVPPVDRGVLMVYNTGDVTRLDCHHPILDLADVKPYLRHLKGYDLPLSAAYPLFTWRVLFRQGRYVGIMHSDDDLPVIAGDSIVTRQPDMAHIMEARHAIARLRPDIHHEVILYDLSKENITRLKPEDYETIFSN